MQFSYFKAKNLAEYYSSFAYSVSTKDTYQCRPSLPTKILILKECYFWLKIKSCYQNLISFMTNIKELFFQKSPTPDNLLLFILV